MHLFHDYGNSLSLICLSLWFCFSYMHLFILFFFFLSLSLFLHLCTSGTFIFLSSGCNLWLLVTLNKHGKRPTTLKYRFHVHLPVSGVTYGHQLLYDTFICPYDYSLDGEYMSLRINTETTFQPFGYGIKTPISGFINLALSALKS